jgi:hypothetical protein
METITKAALAKSIAGQQGISLGRAKLILSLVAAEMEMADETRYSLRTAGELEALVARKLAR